MLKSPQSDDKDGSRLINEKHSVWFSEFLAWRMRRKSKQDLNDLNMGHIGFSLYILKTFSIHLIFNSLSHLICNGLSPRIHDNLYLIHMGTTEVQQNNRFIFVKSLGNRNCFEILLFGLPRTHIRPRNEENKMNWPSLL